MVFRNMMQRNKNDLKKQYDIQKQSLPDFMVVGAAKSGTKSMHHILNHHENIFIPDRELYFYCIDDFEENADFFIHPQEELFCHDYDAYFEEYFEWYTSHFPESGEEQCVGEDSSVYMSSEKAPERIQALLPDVKLLFLLRDPVERACSQYWYNVWTGRATMSFEDTIKYNAGAVINRSLYKKQIERFLNYFDREQCKFILFERFIDCTQNVIDEICGFLNISRSIQVDEIDTKKNAVRLPMSVKAQLLYNRLFPYDRRKWGFSPLPFIPEQNKHPLFRYIHPIYERINPLVKREKPSMKKRTRQFLEDLFQKENRELSKMINRDVHQYWSWFEDENHM